MIVMKQLAIHRFGHSLSRSFGRSLSWSVGMVALFHLPAIAIGQVTHRTVATDQVMPAPLNFESPLSQSAQPRTAQPIQLLAVALSTKDLRLGDRGADVRALQRYLSRNGLFSFAIDGAFGQETADAVAVYQRIRGLSPTGVADEATLVDMNFDFLPAARPAAAEPPATESPSTAAVDAGSLSLNDTGSDVSALQQRLNDFGIPVFVDGDYGFDTQQAVSTYQRVQGLPVTGTANSETLNKMGFSVTRLPYVAAVIADESLLADVQRFFPDAYIDRARPGRFINIGSFGDRFPAEARADAAKARGFRTRVLYR